MKHYPNLAATHELNIIGRTGRSVQCPYCGRHCAGDKIFTHYIDWPDGRAECQGSIEAREERP